MADLTKFQSAMVDMSPLLLSMARGFNSPVGPLGYVDEGLAMMMERKKAQEAKAQEAAAQSAFMSAMGGGGMGAGMGGAGAAPNVPTRFTPSPNSPSVIGDDAMAALGKTPTWLSYSNQGATRNDPIAPELISSMGFLGDMGITMDVVSGGQAAAGSGGARTGSTRHDHGNAADVDFYSNGRKLDWNNPSDLPVLQEIVRTAKARGVTGIGAGDDYMGAGRFHIGFGSPAVWGAGGSSKNAPAWLVEAYNGGSGQAAPAGPQVFDPFQDPTVARIAEVLASPNITAQQAAVLEARMNARIAAISPQAPVEGKAVGDSLVNPYSGEVIYRGETAQVTPMNAAQRAMWGIPTTDTRAYAMGKSGMPEAIGGAAGTTVNVGSGEGEFEKELAKGQATMFNTMAADSVNAQADLGQIDVIEGLMASGAGGAADAWRLWAQNNLGVQIAGGAVEALDAAINKLVPTQRAPGSGTMSDRDVQLFKDSLPKLINTPEGNSVIVGTMRGMAEYKRKQGEIASAVINGTMDRRTAIAELQKLPDPLGAVKAYIKTTTPAVKPIVLDGYTIEEVQ